MKIPYSLLPQKTLKSISHHFLYLGQDTESLFPFLKLSLRQSESKLEVKEYLSMCILSSIFFFFTFLLLMFFFLGALKVKRYILFSVTVSFLFTLFVFIQQLTYPRVFVSRKVRGIERNLIPALQSFLIQLNSGVPLFDIMVNLSSSDYGPISEEFSKAVKEINTGTPQIEALENLASQNPSLYFRRAIWQIVNGMKSGADMSCVIAEIINALSEEQIIQIQKYGSQLNPLAMFYMLIAIISPALGITFIIVISSFISPSETATKMVFYGLFAFAVFFQIIFLGIIKSRRPNLLGG